MPRIPECYLSEPYTSADRHFTTVLDTDQHVALRSVQRFARLGTHEEFSYPNLASGVALINTFQTDDAAYEVLYGANQQVSGINKAYLESGDREGVIFDEAPLPSDGIAVGARATWKASSNIYTNKPIVLDGTVPNQLYAGITPLRLVSMIRSLTAQPRYQAGAELVTRKYADQRINALLEEVEQGMPDSRLYRFSRMLRRAGHAVIFMGMQ